MYPLITLTTDFGTKDGFVGAMKGKILSILPEVNLVDITHEIPAQSVFEAALCIARSCLHFPTDTIHVVVIDPGVGSSRRAILVQTESYFLIGPDNGVFSFLLEKQSLVRIFHIFQETSYWKSHQSFDGLEVFAPVAAHLAKGIPIEEIGTEIDNYHKIQFPSSIRKENKVIGQIIAFDHFGNAITNISKQDVYLNNIRYIQVSGYKKILSLQKFYSEKKNEPIGIINSDHLLEIAIYQESAKKRMRLLYGNEVIGYHKKKLSEENVS